MIGMLISFALGAMFGVVITALIVIARESDERSGIR